MKATKRPHWSLRLSHPVLCEVMTQAEQSRYLTGLEDEGETQEALDHWVADLLTTSHRHPKGMILHLKTGKRALETEPTAPDQDDLFAPPDNVKNKT